MERIKRQQSDTIHHYNENKKRKLQNEIIIINSNKSVFEDLANETIYEIYEYLDFYHIYDGFFDLNERFQNLLCNFNLSIQINASTISKSNFERYHKKMISPNTHRINYLHLPNPFTIDIVFSPPCIALKFLQLETLILDNISGKYLKNILKHLIHLPKLHSLVLSLADYARRSTNLYEPIFCLSKLKYCKITYEINAITDKLGPSFDFLNGYKISPIEHLVINGRFRFEAFDDLLQCLPKLRRLSIDYLTGNLDADVEPLSNLSNDLKYVSLNLDIMIQPHRLEKLIKYFFRTVEVLRLMTRHDQSYFNAERWEQIILSYLPNLRIFDLNHTDTVVDDNYLTHYFLIQEFDSSFWIGKQCFFTHQHYREHYVDSRIFYSTNVYRTRNYTFHWEVNKQNCLPLEKTDSNSVKHIYICSNRITNECTNYFPNVTELTIKYCSETSDDFIATTLNRILPLIRLTKLEIKCSNLSFEQFIHLLWYTPNLHTLKMSSLFKELINVQQLTQTSQFRYVSKTNKIKNLIFGGWNTLDSNSTQLVIYLFPKVEYLKTSIIRKEIVPIGRLLLTETNHKISRLCFLCITHIPKICLQELNVLIKSEHLLDDYFIKFAKCDLYLWW